MWWRAGGGWAWGGRGEPSIHILGMLFRIFAGSMQTQQGLGLGLAEPCASSWPPNLIRLSPRPFSVCPGHTCRPCGWACLEVEVSAVFPLLHVSLPTSFCFGLRWPSQGPFWGLFGPWARLSPRPVVSPCCAPPSLLKVSCRPRKAVVCRTIAWWCPA